MIGNHDLTIGLAPAREQSPGRVGLLRSRCVGSKRRQSLSDPFPPRSAGEKLLSDAPRVHRPLSIRHLISHEQSGRARAMAVRMAPRTPQQMIRLRFEAGVSRSRPGDFGYDLALG